MAKRRMFSLAVVDTDNFLDLPASSQALYFHLGMRADDDGFLGNVRTVQRTVGASMDDLRLLVAKGFLIQFDSGVCAIRDWNVNNYIPKDRYEQTRYTNEKSTLFISADKTYNPRQECTQPVSDLDTSCIQNVSSLYTDPYTDCIQNVSNPYTQVSIDQDSIDQEREYPPDGGAHALDSDTPKRETRKKYGQYKRVLLSGKEYSSLLTELGEQELDRCITYLDESAEMTDNKNRWKNWAVVIRKCSREKWGEVAKVPGKTEPEKNRFADYV